MSKSITVSYEGKPCYDILLEQNFLKLTPKLKELNISPKRKVCIVTDSNLAVLHADALAECIKPYFDSCITFCFPAGEQSKNLDTVQNLYQELINHHFDRKDLLIAFGGGVVGDLTGFTAATYLRGIDFIQIPTSLLSQVDSSIGGKTGVDFLHYKNMVGSFYQPKLVYMNLSLLKTLPKDQFISGMGEVLKHGFIKSADYFSWLKQNQMQIMNLSFDIIEEMIYQSCQIKRDVVERDPKETGERALLNFGHTIGHAVEKLSDFKLSHGQCVSIGIAAASRLSCDVGTLRKEDCAEIIRTLQAFGLLVSVSRFTPQEILSVSKSDKKMSAGKIKFILLESIGNAYIDADLSDAQLLSGITSILKDSDGRREEDTQNGTEL